LQAITIEKSMEKERERGFKRIAEAYKSYNMIKYIKIK